MLRGPAKFKSKTGWLDSMMPRHRVALLLSIGTSAALADTNLRNMGFGERRLTTSANYPNITGYAPSSDVRDLGNIDLDLREMEASLANPSGPNWEAARSIYEQGANSGARAEITVGALPAEADPVQGTTVYQIGHPEVQGYLQEHQRRYTASNASSVLVVAYTSTCKEGGLASPSTAGCFILAGGEIRIGNPGASPLNAGFPTAITNSYRTLMGFSTQANTQMLGQEFFTMYRAYYGTGPYAHQRVADALTGTASCATCDSVARVEIAQKSAVYLGVWMYVIRAMEDAIMTCTADCLACNVDSEHLWDEAVALYSGSLERTDPGGTLVGKLLYRLAEDKCRDFGTCLTTPAVCQGGQWHPHAEETSCSLVVARVNERVMEQFARGRDKLLAGHCVEVIPIKKRIVELMSVPLVQGALHSAFEVVRDLGQSIPASRERARGSVFAAAILPRIAACGETGNSAAEIIRSNQLYDAAGPMNAGYAAVKHAYESVYECLGITCEDVGGISDVSGSYRQGAEPCVTQAARTNEDSSPPRALIAAVMILLSLVAICFCVCCLYWYCRAKTYTQMGEAGGPPPRTYGA